MSEKRDFVVLVFDFDEDDEEGDIADGAVLYGAIVRSVKRPLSSVLARTGMAAKIEFT